MRILTINTKFTGGGASKIAYSIHKSINNLKGYESIFLAGYGEKRDEYCVKINNDKLKYLSALSFRIISREIDFSVSIEEYIKSSDIIHLHNLHGYYINYEKIIDSIIKYDKPLIWTLHDIWSFTGRCAIATSCEKWKNGCNKCSNKKLYPKSIIDKCRSEFLRKKKLINKLNKKKTIIVTPSYWLKNLAKESILKDFEIINIPNGIEVKSEIAKEKIKLREKYGIPTDRQVVLFVAADPNDKLKGIDLLIKSIENLKDTIFISVGKRIRLEYKNLIQLGYVDSNESMNEIYSLSDIYVNPSLSENFPTTNLEAFSNCIPVIGFNIGGITEQLQGSCGILVKDINEDSLLNEIRRLKNDDELRETIANNALRKLNLQYSYNNFIDSYINLYNKIID